MKAKPLFPNQAVTNTNVPPSEALIEVIQRIVADLKEQDESIKEQDESISAIRSEFGYQEFLGTNTSNATTTLADTGLQIAVTAGVRYRFCFTGFYIIAASSTGARFVLDGPALTFINYSVEITDSATTKAGYYGLSAYNTPAAASVTSASATSNMVKVEGLILPSASGDLKLRFATEVAASGIVLRAGSFVDWTAVP